MPTYEYLCGKCGHEFEREQRITEDPVKTCPQCRARKVQRLISRTGFLLKGSGWYSDLYSSAKPASDKPAGDTSSSEAKAETKAESKPKTESKTSDAKPAADKKPSRKSTNAA